MADLNYIDEKFALGVRILATNPGPIRERLIWAYTHALMLAHPADPDVPADVRRRIDFLDRRMTDPQGGDGTIEAAVNAMTEDQSIEAAREIYDIAYLVRGLSAQHREPRGNDG